MARWAAWRKWTGTGLSTVDAARWSDAVEIIQVATQVTVPRPAVLH